MTDTGGFVVGVCMWSKGGVADTKRARHVGVYVEQRGCNGHPGGLVAHVCVWVCMCLHVCAENNRT